MSIRIGERSEVNELLLPGLFLLVLTVVGLGASTPELGLVGDDWWFFSHLSDGNLLAAQLKANPARPGVAYLWWGLWRVFGLRIWMYYTFSFVVQWLTAFVLLIVFSRILRWRMLSAFAVASFFLLYPADITRVYLSTLSTRVCVLLAVTASATWLDSTRVPLVPRVALQGFSLLLMILSLLTYETPLLLFAALPLVSLGKRDLTWFRRGLSCYLALGLYVLFRLWINQVVSLRSPTPYASIRLNTHWLISQLSALPSAVITHGWLYSLAATFSLGLRNSCVLLLLALPVLFLFILWTQRDGADAEPNWGRDLRLMGTGTLLSAMAVAPVIVSNLSLRSVIGTLNARFVHAAALGQGIFMTGLCSLPWSLLPLGRRPARLWRTTSLTLFLTLALMGGIATQRDYVGAWTAQMGLLEALQEEATALRDNTAILLLDVPARPLHLRFYYPLTQLVRRFYSNPTVHLLPWQHGFPPHQQLVAFGDQSVVAATDIVHREPRSFRYDRILAFQMEPDGDLKPVEKIRPGYLLRNSPEELPFQTPRDWTPASEPIMLGDQRRNISGEPPADTPWRDWLLSQMVSGATNTARE